MQRSRSNKYHSRKVVADGMTFDSRKEYLRWCELSLLAKVGKITNLQRQVKFVLIPAQYEPDTIGKRGGKKRGKLIERECSYIADFVYEKPITMEKMYFANGKSESMTVNCGFETVVEDTKGFKTTDYIIKRKLMLYVHGIRINEI
jgi:hypothetical protein